MSWISRRELFAGAGGVFAAWLTRRRAAAAASIPPAPVARVAVVKDTYFGETLSDPYRGMENDKDPDWLPFLKGQNEHARAHARPHPRARAALKSSSSNCRATRRRRGWCSAPAASSSTSSALWAPTTSSYWCGKTAARAAFLIDPTLLSSRDQPPVAGPGGGHPPTVRTSSTAISKDGSEDSIPARLGVADGRDLPERIANTEDANPQWLADGSGFFYNQLTGAVDTPERYLDSQARYSQTGHLDPASDPILMKRGLDPRVQYERIQMPNVVVHEGLAPMHCCCSPNVREENAVFSSLRSPMQRPTGRSGRRWRASRTRSPIPRSMATRSICWPSKGHPRVPHPEDGGPMRPSVAGRDRNDPRKAAWSSTALDGPWDGLYLAYGAMGAWASCGVWTRDAQVADITLPFDGNPRGAGGDGERGRRACSPSPAGSPRRTSGASTRAAGSRPTGLTAKPPIDVSHYETTRFMVKARDGTPIPCSLLYRKGLEARWQYAGVDFGLRFLWHQRLYAGIRGNAPWR